MNIKTQYHLLTLGAIIYSIGYGVFIAAFLRGEIEGLAGVAGVIMATGILIAIIFGALLARVQAEVLGEL